MSFQLVDFILNGPVPRMEKWHRGRRSRILRASSFLLESINTLFKAALYSVQCTHTVKESVEQEIHLNALYIIWKMYWWLVLMWYLWCFHSDSFHLFFSQNPKLTRDDMIGDDTGMLVSTAPACEVTYFVFQRKNHNTQTIWVQREFLYKDMVSFCMLMSWLGNTANITRLRILICTNVGY